MTLEDIIAQKKALRRIMRERKKEITPADKQAEADRVFATIETMEAFQQAQNILLYYSLPDELPTHSILDRWHRIKHVFLPRVKGDDLDIVAYTGVLDDNNAFHIGEPVGPVVDFIPELIIVPAVALDCACHRMGRGRGYYDRLLNASKSYKIGVALECQLVTQVPCEPHDQKLDAVVTASQVSYSS
ncbi:MAG: 5-formyltetrahydrofolate cyclo-ligase [Muribaculaceae bacterium]|nr:5-formyltetrahydrofolate cyclo-ligase [Muribaculaceae bacterium]